VRIAITGAGGFLAGHLAKRLRADGHNVVGIDIKPLEQWWQASVDYAWHGIDIRGFRLNANPFRGLDRIYHLACDMGGRGYIEAHESACAMNAMLDTMVLHLAAVAGVPRLFYASSACIYPAGAQRARKSVPLFEQLGDPPWEPDGMYGFEKLFGELAAQAFAKEHGLEVRIGRYHGIFGSHGSWNDGREKAPAAMMRKAIHSARTGSVIDVWGVGDQRRTFLHVDDAVEATVLLMESECSAPLNIGSEEVVTINELAGMCAEIVGAKGPIVHSIGPEGPHSRASDNALIRKVLGWAPKLTLREGLALTIPWIADQMDLAEAVEAA
jgi:GDP-D-mannose 3',5'-epimerase